MKAVSLGGVALFIALGLISHGNLKRPAPALKQDELQLMVPVPMQILGAFGDRFLAANIGVWRALMVGTEHRLSAQELRALAQVQETAAWLNPGHEDNYYIATAILPWEGHVEETQRILDWADQSRPHDVYPPFFYGFNLIEFKGDFETASKYAYRAAQKSGDPGEKQALSVISARWSERTDDPEQALRTVQHMAKETHDPALRHYLEQRMKRLEGLVQLRIAAREYKNKFGQAINDLNQLVEKGLLQELPTDPLGGGYTLANHWPVLRSPKD